MVKYIVVLLCGALSVSCIFDTEECFVEMPSTPVVLEGEHTISFTIGFDSSTTRVACNPTDEKVPFDHYIQPGTLRVMLTDTLNNTIGEIERLYIWPTNEAQTEFKFTGKLPDGLIFDPKKPNISCSLLSMRHPRLSTRSLRYTISSNSILATRRVLYLCGVL